MRVAISVKNQGVHGELRWPYSVGQSGGPFSARSWLLYAPETKSLSEAAGYSGRAGVKAHRL
jgi:hypothetical protein